MRTGRIFISTVAMLIACSIGSSIASAEDWPRWRGPQGDGISREKGLLETWPQSFKPLWTAEVGAGYAGPVAQAGRIYLFHRVDREEMLTCFDAASGKIIWSEAYESAWRGGYPGTRASPNIDGKFIYTYGSGGDLVSRDLATGKLQWRLNVLRENKSAPLEWAQASNPLIDGNLIYVQSGTGGPVAVAVDKTNGQIAWRSQATGTASYSHPIMANVEGVKQLIVFAAAGPIGMNPATGKTIWLEPWQTQYDVNASDPIYHAGHLFITSNYGSGAMMLKLSKTGAQKLWDTKEVMGRFQPGILDGGHLYVNSEGTLKCLQWPTKNVKWTTGRNEKNLLGVGGSMVRFGGDKMILLSQGGRLTLARATPDSFARISDMPDFVDGSEVWATPTIYDGKLYVKGEKELVCVDIKAK